jgi:hypothetical protein
MSGVSIASGVVATDGLPSTSGVTPGYVVTWDGSTVVWAAGGGGGGGAPTGAQYIVAASDATLTAERVGTDTTTITWDFGTAGQAKLNAVANTSVQKIEVVKNSGAVVGTRKQLNFIEGSNVTLTIADDGVNDQVDITIASSGGGGVTDGDKGDITVSSSGTVWTVDNDVVTFAKMQNIATDRLIGRDTAATGDPEEISLDATLEWTGTGSIQRAALTGDVTASAGSNSTTIPNNTVTYAKMQDISATDRLLGRDTAGAGDTEELTVSGGIEFTGAGGIQTSAFTGDATKTAGGTALTLATVNSNVGSFGTATQVGTFTVNAKGLITAASNTAIAVTSAAVTDFNEAAQDAVGGILTDTGTIDFTYNDAVNTISAIVVNNSITDTQLRTGAATSVIGRSANSTGNVADIAAAADGDILRRSAGVLGFGSIPESSVTNLTTDLAAKQPNIQFKDEGVNQGTSGGITAVDFVGAGVTAAAASGTLTVTISGGGGGGGTPGGSDTHVQYNAAGSFGGEAAFTYDYTNDQLTVPGLTVSQDTLFTGVITPTQLTADTDNWNPTNLATSTTIRVDVSKEIQITGIAGGTSGRVLNLINITQFPILLPEENTSSTASNRFTSTGDFILFPGGRVQLIYDGTTSRWTLEETNIYLSLSKMYQGGYYL